MYVADEYKNLQQSGVNILVMPFISNLLESSQVQGFFEKKNKAKQYLTAKEIELLENYMPIFLEENTFAKVTKAEKETIKSKIKFNYISLEEKEDTTTQFYLPNLNQYAYDGVIPQYLFFVQDAFFNKTGDGKGVSLGRGSETFFVIDAGIKYLLWDNIKNKVAAYGKLQTKQKLFSLPTKESYLTILELFVNDMVSQSPFAQKKIYF
jgi:hypothetical protein